jgi:hypothetical protein
VRVSILPQRTQAWVTSLRSSDSAPLAIRVRVIAVITIWRPQCVQGRRKVGRLEGATSLYCMELFQLRDVPVSLRPFPARFERVSTSFCAAHIICASRHPSASILVRPARRPHAQARAQPQAEQYDIIEACSSGPFLELFARGTRPNWAVWGNQADDDYAPTWKTYAHHSQANRIEAAE